jgi:hypothetical protein
MKSDNLDKSGDNLKFLNEKDMLFLQQIKVSKIKLKKSMIKSFKISMKAAIIAVLLFNGSFILKAQAPYKMSIGGIVGNMEGASFKLFFADKLAFQTDLGVKFVTAQLSDEPNHNSATPFSTFEVNSHVMFENNIKSSETGQLLWFIGVGASIGYQFEKNGKFGGNIISGIEYSLVNTPISLQIDYRPGFGMLFRQNAIQPYFDWGFALSMRYNFKK